MHIDGRLNRRRWDLEKKHEVLYNVIVVPLTGRRAIHIASISVGTGIRDRSVKVPVGLSLMQRIRMTAAIPRLFQHHHRDIFLNHNNNIFTFVIQLIDAAHQN